MRFQVKYDKNKSLEDSVYETKQQLYKEHKLEALFFEVTSRCNARCEHCGSSCGDFVPKDEMTYDEIISVMDDVAEHYNPKDIMFFFTGGEPLVRKDFFELTDYANKLGFAWGITTNGMLIDEETVKKMVETNMYSVSVSIDGLKETHEKFRKVPGSFDKILKGIQLMHESNAIPVIQVTTCVNKKNIHELEEMHKLMKKIGIKNWRIITVDPIGRAKDNDELLLSPEQYKQVFNFMLEKRIEDPEMTIMYGCGHYWGNVLNTMLIGTFYTCFTGYWVASILSNGDIFGCPDIERLPELIEGNIRKDKFSDVWENGFKRYRKIDRTCNETCAACPDWKICTGDAFHTWDFKNNKPNFCARELYKDEFAKRDELRGIKTEKSVKKTTKKSTTKKTTKTKK
ncbi:MAG: radical SAM protein [Candidatus Coprovivens sp.]